MRVVVFKMRAGGVRRRPEVFQNDPIGPGELRSFWMTPSSGSYQVPQLRPISNVVAPPFALLYEPQLTAVGNDRLRFRGYECTGDPTDAPTVLQEWLCVLGDAQVLRGKR